MYTLRESLWNCGWEKWVIYWFTINGIYTLKMAARKNSMLLNYVAEKWNEMIAVKTKSIWLNINHRCNGNWGLEMSLIKEKSNWQKTVM